MPLCLHDCACGQSAAARSVGRVVDGELHDARRFPRGLGAPSVFGRLECGSVTVMMVACCIRVGVGVGLEVGGGGEVGGRGVDGCVFVSVGL